MKKCENVLRAISIPFVPALVVYWIWWLVSNPENYCAWYLLGAVMWIWFWMAVACLISLIYLDELPSEKKPPFFKIASIISAVLVLSCLVYIPHSWMVWKIQPIVHKFWEEVANGPDHEYRHPSNADHDYVELDYGGRLDAILYERDNFVKEHGFIFIGQWHTNGNFGIYLYVGRHSQKSQGP